MTSSIQERVARGVALLDEKEPGWEKKIDLQSLHMENCFECMLGQLYGDFAWGTSRLKLRTHRDEVEHGFNTSSHNEDDIDWTDLREEWVRVIKQRRGEQ